MTAPTPAAQVWREVYVNAGAVSPSVRACVSAAVRIADQVWRQVLTDPTLDTHTRRRLVSEDSWATTALAAYQHLSGDGAYAHLDVPTRLRCWADPHTLAAWLAGPSALPGFESVSVAATWGITDDTFHWEADDVATTMRTLIDQAQLAGHYGLPGYTITLRHTTSDDPISDSLFAADVDGDTAPIIEHQVTVQTPSGAVLASAPIPTDHLTDDRCGVAAAVAVLTNTAQAVNELLADEARIVTHAHDTLRADAAPPRLGSTRRGFTPLDLTPTTSVAAAIAPAVPPPPDRRPHR